MHSEKFAKKLREERVRLGLTLEELAAVGGVKLLAQHNYETAKRSPDANYLERVAQVGVDVARLLMAQNAPYAVKEPSAAAYATLNPLSVRAAVRVLAEWLDSNKLHLEPEQMAEAVLTLCDLADDAQQIEAQAPKTLRMLKLVA